MEKAPFGEIRVFLRLQTLIIALLFLLEFLCFFIRQVDFHEIESPEKRAGLVSFGSVIQFMCDKKTKVDYQRLTKLSELLNLGKGLAQTETIKPLNENAE